MSVGNVRVAALLIALGVSTLAHRAHGLGGLVVNPTRLEFGDRERGAELRVRNGGDQGGTFRLSFLNVRMMDDGKLEAVGDDDSGQATAAALVRYSPRQITLAPGQIQTVRLRVRKPADLADGEYRSHLLFQAIPEVDVAAEDAIELEGERGMQVRLTPVYGVSIPIIVRHGDTTADVDLVDAVVLDDRPAVALRINRSGDRSVYGDFRVSHVGPTGAETLLAELNGVAVYPPVASRPVEIPFDLLADAPLPAGGTLRIVYTDAEKGRDRVLGSASVKLQ